MWRFAFKLYAKLMEKRKCNLNFLYDNNDEADTGAKATAKATAGVKVKG